MVGYGSSLRRARRSGWHDAYMDYDQLKAVLYQIESLYDEISTDSLLESTCDLRKARSDDAGEIASRFEGDIEEAPSSSVRYNRERSLSELLASTVKDGGDSSLSDFRLIEANRRARSLAEQFLSLLQSEVEKVCLFALARQGELADAVGALRFASVPLRVSVSSGDLTENLNGDQDADDWPSDDEDNSDSWETGELALGETAALLPRPESMSSLTVRRNSGISLRSSKASSTQTHPMFRGDGVLTASLVGAARSSLAASSDVNDKLSEYSALGVELLHLLKYICVNAMGVRKIMKKHDKLLSQKMLGGYHRGKPNLRSKGVIHRRGRSEVPGNPDIRPFDLQIAGAKPGSHLLGGGDVQLQQLANSGSIAAITASIQSALLESPVPPSETNDPSLVRLECVVSSVHVLRECAEVVNTPFEAFLSRKAMIVTGHDLGGLDGSTKKALVLLLQFKPDSILRMDTDALARWRERAAERVLAYPGGYGGPIRPRLIGYAGESKACRREKEQEFRALGGIGSAAMAVNLLSTLLYTVNYYIVAPTANHYAILLGTDGAYGATLVGASSFMALFAAFLYSWWYTRSSFRSALFFSSLCPCVGNLLYSYAISRRSMAIAMSGRLLVGFGSAEVVNRQIISTCVSFRSMTQASALFVAAGALGMSVGPLLAAILDTVAGRDVDVDLEVPLLGGIICNHVTSPGFLMAGLWFVEILLIAFCFHEPERINGNSSTTSKSQGKLDPKNGNAIEDGANETADVITTYGTGEQASQCKKKPAMSNHTNMRAPFLSEALSEISTIGKLIFRKPALPITLLLFAFIELVDEVLISSCSMVCRRYFKWHGSTAGFFIASLGALVLPAHFIVERASRFYDERAIMKYSIVFICASLFAVLNYQGMITDTIGLSKEAWDDAVEIANSTTEAMMKMQSSRRLGHHRALPYDWGAGVYVYLVSLAAAFMATIVLEAVDTSLMSKVTPAKLNDTFINCGLLATLVGTLGRVLGDSMITLSALIDKNVFTDFVNDTFFPMIPLALIGYYFVRKHYKKLL